MSSINPGIPLSVNPPQQPVGPLQQYGQIMSVQSLINQNALQKQEQQRNAIIQQSEQLQLQEQQRNQGNVQKFNQVFHDAGGDWNKAIQSAPAAGVDGDFLLQRQTARAEQVQKLAQAEKANLDLNIQKHDEIAKSADRVANADPDQQPTLYAQERNRLILDDHVNPTEVPEKMPPVDALKQTANSSKAVRDMYKDAADLKDKQASAAKTAAELPGAIAKSNIEQQDAALTPQERAGLKAPATLEDRKYEEIVANQKLGKPVAPADLAWKAAYEKRKTLVPVAQVNLQSSLLNPATKQMLGQNYAETGALPTGLRSPAMSAQILNEAAKNGPVDIASAKASYNADSAALKKLTTQSSTINAFENTAGKNLDVFLGQAQKVADSGLPVLNLPIRMVAGRLGSTDQAAFDTARTTALTEIARVLNSPNASGVVSDSARHEVEGLIKGDATLAQVMSAAKILKQDMANRRSGNAQEIAEIKARLSHGQPQEQQNGAPAPEKHPFFDQFGGQAKPQ